MITSRKEERQAIVALLESDSFESADRLADALLKQVFQLLQQRSLYGLRWGMGGGVVPVGPFATERDAERFYRERGSDAPSAVCKLFGPDLFREPDLQNRSCTCGHVKALHQHEKGAGWCWALGGTLKKGNPCGCKAFEEAGDAQN